MEKIKRLIEVLFNITMWIGFVALAVCIGDLFGNFLLINLGKNHQVAIILAKFPIYAIVMALYNVFDFSFDCKE